MAARQAVAETTIVQRCVESIRHMILTGELLPGETLRQENLAEQIAGESGAGARGAHLLTGRGRSHLRRACRVMRSPASEVRNWREIYLMRSLLERELLKNIDMGAVDTAVLETLNDALESSTTPTPRFGSTSGSTASFTSPFFDWPRCRPCSPKSNGCGIFRSSIAVSTPTSPTIVAKLWKSTDGSSRRSSPVIETCCSPRSTCTGPARLTPSTDAFAVTLDRRGNGEPMSQILLHNRRQRGGDHRVQPGRAQRAYPEDGR